MIRFGIIGCSRIASLRHIPECYENPKAEIAGYYNRTREKAVQMAKLYGGRVYHNIEECILDSNVDAVIISTPNRTHAPIAIRALAEGKHVVCEKPMAVTMAECCRMAEAARCNNRILLIGLQERYTQTHRMARNLISEGVIGKVLGFQAIFAHGGPEKKRQGENLWFYDQEQAGLGVSADLGIHKIDTFRFLLNDEVVESTVKLGYAKTASDKACKHLVDNNAAFVLKMKKGAVGTIMASWTCYGAERNSMVLFGSEGTMLIEHPYCGKVRIMMKNGEEKEYSAEELYRANGWADSGIIREMIRLIEQGQRQSGEDTLETMRAVFAGIGTETEEKGKGQ